MTSGMSITNKIGPASDLLPNNLLEGYNPPSRNGEQTRNAYVDSFAYGAVQKLPSSQTGTYNALSAQDFTRLREEPHVPWHDWATVTPGVICVSRKDRSSRYAHWKTAETAQPVIACAWHLDWIDNADYVFAGVARTKSIVPPDDGRGPSIDEYFTLTIGGVVSLLNNGSEEIYNGDLVAWTFRFPDSTNEVARKKVKYGARMIGIEKAESPARVIGRALQYAKRGELVDVLIRL